MYHEVELPWVEYRAEPSEEELRGIVEDSANLLAALNQYEMWAVVEGVSELLSEDSSAKRSDAELMVLFTALTLYHMAGKLLDISPLMRPMKLRVDGGVMTVSKGVEICCQSAKAYTHYIDGSIKWQRDLYRVLSMVSELLCGSFLGEEILQAYSGVLTLIGSGDSKRLGTKIETEVRSEGE